jgi:cellulose synthase (UDP-forming)
MIHKRIPSKFASIKRTARLESIPTHSRVRYTLLSSVGILIVGLFAFWWLNPAHIAHNFNGPFGALDVLLFLLVTYVIWQPIIMEMLSWAIASHIKEPRHYPPAKGLKVAFITTFVPHSESIELLHKTLPAMLNVQYEHETWVLDEGNDPRVKSYCEDIGVKHFSRSGKLQYNAPVGKYAQRTKGGNHNSWYDSYGSDYDIVAQIDTDFIPKRSFLVRTLGYFHDPKIAFVGTPQIYGNTKGSFIARGAAEQTYSFYGPILRGLYGMQTTLLIGANHVIRVKALKDVDYYSAHITEDLLTGMKLHANGWKSVYVHEALAIGEGPTTWQAYFNQQMRWAYGCIDIFFKHSPKLFRKMGVRRSIYYFFLQQHYFSGLAMILGIMCLGLYFFFGINAASIRLVPFLEHYLPALAACFLLSLYLQRYNVRPREERGLMLAGKIASVAAWPIFFMAFMNVILGRQLTYIVTPKGANSLQPSDNFSFRVFRIHLCIGLFCIACIAAAFREHHRSVIMLFWAFSSLGLMLVLPLILGISHAYAYIMTQATVFVGGGRRSGWPSASMVPPAPLGQQLEDDL